MVMEWRNVRQRIEPGNGCGRTADRGNSHMPGISEDFLERCMKRMPPLCWLRTHQIFFLIWRLVDRVAALPGEDVWCSMVAPRVIDGCVSWLDWRRPHHF